MVVCALIRTKELRNNLSAYAADGRRREDLRSGLDELKQSCVLPSLRYIHPSAQYRIIRTACDREICKRTPSWNGIARIVV